MRVRCSHLRALLAVIAAVLILGAAPAAAQDTPPPKPTQPTEPKDREPPPRPPRRDTRPKAPPKPVLMLSADIDCSIELDGEIVAELQKDVVHRIQITAGEHLLQAFPIGIDGPVWKETLKAPDTGTVVATIELLEVVEDWREQMKNLDRFTVTALSVRDNENGFVWAKNVGPEMRSDQAAGFCAGLTADGLRGWRVPSLNELSTLYYPDHDDPTQEPCRGDPQRSLFFKKKGEIEVLPRLIYEPLEHNSVCSLWVLSGNDDRVSCSFLGEFNCATEKRKHTAGVLCVTTSTGPS